MTLYAKFGAIVMDLSKALNHNLLFCIVKAYGSDANALTFI